MTDWLNPSLKQSLVDKLSLCLKVYQDAEDYGVVELASHPLNYADTLIRIGYEPFPPIEQRSLFGMSTPHLILPGVLPYAQYITLAEGFPGVFRCVWPCLARKYVSTGVYRFIQSRCPIRDETAGDAPLLSQQFTTSNLSVFLKEQAWTLLCKMAATVASHPFHVVAVRCMGQLVGREESYKYPTQCIAEIFKSEGFLGFFSGLTPRLVGDIIYTSTSAVLCISFMHSLQTVNELIRPDIRVRLESFVPFLAHVRITKLPSSEWNYSYTYFAGPYGNQFYNMSDIMIVNGTSLSIGNQPFMPVYNGWTDCWSRLRRDKRFKSSSGLFSRLYTGPYISTAVWGLKPFGDNFGPTYFPTDGQHIPYLLRDYYAPLIPLNSLSVKDSLEIFKDALLSNEVIMSALDFMT